MSDLEFDYDSDQEVSENHSKFIDTVRQLDKGQRVKKPERSEPSLEVSEFHLVKSGIADDDAVAIEDLAKTLGKKGHHADISKKINATKERSKVLPKPLEKPAAERIKRTVGFENTRKELGKWAGIIARNRTAANVTFPLSQVSINFDPAEKRVKQFRLQSELEKKLAEVDPPKEPEEEKDEFPLTIQEILEKRSEAAKFRAQQSYKVAKAHRQNKIKSKKFHRIQRKEKIKKALKEFEELQKTDPQAALEKLEQLDRSRAEERMTLRHKSTGQWAKSKLIRAKYDKESRQVLAEQLSISRDLTQKIKKDDDSEEDDDENQPIHLMSGDKENPWINTVKSESEIDAFISGYRKYWDEKNKSENNENNVSNNKSNDANQNKPIFVVPEINHMSNHKNPVEQVIEEYFPEENGVDKDDNTDASENENTNNHVNKKSIKKLQKNSKNGLDVKSPKSKVTKVKSKNVKAGTSSWSVTSVNSTTENNSNNVEDLDLDEMFDSVDDKLQDKINKKLAKVKQMLEQETKKEMKRENKKRKRKTNDSIDDVEKLGLKGQKIKRPVIDKPIEESANSQPSNEDSQIEKITNLTNIKDVGKPQSKATEIDPNKFINIKPKHINTLLPDEAGGEEEVLDDNEVEEDQHQIISEAFADDDVVEEFQKEKEDEIKKSQPEDIDLRLPGWGSWGGKDIKPSSRKKRRFLLKFPKEAQRRDKNKSNVYIYEEKCPKIKKHLVNDLPFPFTSVQDYEASMRAPVGRDFVPEKVFSKLIHPAVETKMGTVIEPMNEEALVNTKAMAKKVKKLVNELAKKKDAEKNKPEEKTNEKKNFKNVKRRGKQNKSVHTSKNVKVNDSKNVKVNASKIVKKILLRE